MELTGEREEATMIKWHRFNGSDIDHVEQGGYRSNDNQWLVIRTGNGMAEIWQEVSEHLIDNNGPGLPWFTGNPFSLVTKIDNQWFVNRWTARNIGDGKYEVEQDYYRSSIN